MPERFPSDLNTRPLRPADPFVATPNALSAPAIAFERSLTRDRRAVLRAGMGDRKSVV